MELWGITDSGKVRRHNQDVFRILYDEDKGVAVLVVCDGMGGARSGNVASALAADAFTRFMGKCVEDIEACGDIAMQMADAVIVANKAVFEKSLSANEFYGMGTTLAAAISTPEGEIIVNIGDSRAYHVTQSSITQITKDHSVVEDMIARGDLTRGESYKHPSKHLITRAIGAGPDEEPDVFFLEMSEGEYMLLCTDGLSNIVMDSEMLFELQRGGNIRDICERLIATALERGAPDNVTVILFRK